jgi:tetratricopeptide (TPR) repeat protein
MSLTTDPRRTRIIRRVLTGLTVAVGVGGLGWSARQSLRSSSSLDNAIGLASAGRLDEAEAKVRARLAADPDAAAAHLLLAQIILKRPDQPAPPSERCPSPSGQEALDHLDRVHPENPSMAVIFHLCRGDALKRLMRFDGAEADWLEALRIDTTAPEVGWNLLHLYYLQGREEESRRLALRLYRVEPDPHDRVTLLVELLRRDVRPPAPGSIERILEPVLRYNPGDLHSGVAMGLALTRANQVESGIDQLRSVVRTHPDSVEAWDALLTGLDESGQVDIMEEELERLPAALADAPRLIKHRARIAQDDNRWNEAVDLFRRARADEPDNRVVEFRLSRALRHAGEAAEAGRIEERVRRREVALQELRPLFDQAVATPNLGIRPNPELYQRIAETRERMQLPEEASAWHRLVLANDPKNEVSLAALARLADAGDSL